MIPQSFIQELLARLDIVEVVERYLPLRKAGANHVACCPFHTEKTPSFTVSPAKQFYHCFGCGAHGSAIGFLMEHRGLGYVEAIRELAQSAGMTVPAPAPDDSRAEAPAEDLAAVMLRAARYYQAQLKASSRAIAYLTGRGMTGAIAARFGIGYAPEGWRNLDAVFEPGEAPVLVRCGLLVESDSGRTYDRFRDRIMFPILDARGNVIGFGGRVIDDGQPKYMNSPETPLFDKGRELYGLPQARIGIREADAVIVVEGYMDVVALAQYGVTNVVATLGTATTPAHVRKLLQLARRVVFCFDGDAAGRKAAWRALEACLEPLTDERAVGFLFLPDEHDPDSYVREFGADDFRRRSAQAVPLSEFLLRELRDRGELQSAEGRSRLLAEAKPLIARIGAPMLRAQLVRALAALGGLTPPELASLFGLRGAYPTRAAAPPAPRGRASFARRLLRIVLCKPEWSASIPLELLAEEEPEARLLHDIAGAFERGELPAERLDTVMELFRGTAHERLIGEVYRELAIEQSDEASMEAVFVDAMDQLRRHGLSREIAALNAKERREGLSGEERCRLAELLASKQKLAAARAPGSPACL